MQDQENNEQLRNRPIRSFVLRQGRLTVAQQRALVTAEREFGNSLLYPPGSHAGVVLVRIPEELGPA